MASVVLSIAVGAGYGAVYPVTSIPVGMTGLREFRHASVIDRVELGLMSRIWNARWRGGDVTGVEKGDLVLELVGRVLGPLMLAERETGRDDCAPLCCANRGCTLCWGGEMGIGGTPPPTATG